MAVFPVLKGGKKPIVPKGVDEGTTDEEQINEWSTGGYKDANIGVACGPSGYTVLDVDVHKGGLESLKELYKDPVIAKALKATRRARTGTGGYHFYFTAREGITLKNSVGKNDESPLGKGLDIRTQGGYVVAPPSINSDGNAYKWEQYETIVDFPLELVAKLKVEKWNPLHITGDPVGEGGRNDYLMRIGCSMRAKGFEHDEILSLLQIRNQNQCTPPLPDEEIAQITGSVCRYEPGEELERFRNELREKKTKTNSRKGKKKLDVTTYDKIADEELKWLWYGRIAYGKFGLLVGLPGKTKSYLTCFIAAKVTIGEPLPDDYVNVMPEPRSVLLITYEDGQGDTIKKRLSKCGADMSKVYTIPMESESFSKDDWDALEAVLVEHPDIGLVIIDPVQAIMQGADDNNETVVRDALNPALRLGHKYGVSFLGIKHLNKDEKKSIDNRVGGSQAYTGLARTILLAGHDNEKEYGEHGEVFAGLMVTKGNISGRVPPIAYEVNDRGLFPLGTDLTITPERLLPRPPNKKDKN